MSNDLPIPIGNNSINARQLCWTPESSAVDDIQIALPEFYFGDMEMNLPSSIEVAASLEYPIGHLNQFSFDGAARGVVNPGGGILYSDKMHIHIAANSIYYIRTYVRVPNVTGLHLTPSADSLPGEWVNWGNNLDDQTMSLAVQNNVAPGYAGFSIGVLGRPEGQSQNALGIIGDSIAQGAGDGTDPIYGGFSIERGLRNVVSVLNLAKGGDQLSSYMRRSVGRTAILRGAITHLMDEYGRNDLSAGMSADALLRLQRQAIAPFAALGIKVYATTILPHTRSTDGWETTRNQTIVGAAAERQRVAYNSMLRSQWKELGLSGIFDFAHVVDPSDSGKWNTDGVPGDGSYGSATLAGGAVESVAVARGNRGHATGQGYPPSSEIPCIVLRYPDDPIKRDDAIVVAQTNAAGSVTSYGVRSGGSYTYAPMVAPLGSWTRDGLHPSVRGYDAMISGAKVSAQSLN